MEFFLLLLLSQTKELDFSEFTSESSQTTHTFQSERYPKSCEIVKNNIDQGVIQCSAATIQTEIEFQATGGPIECSSDVYPPAHTRISGLFRDINDGFDFGESTNTSALLSFHITRFYALSEFGTDRLDFRRRIVFEDAPSSHNLMRIGTFSVSECPGDFTETARCRKQIQSLSTLFFSTRPDDDPELYCLLEPGERYYINFIHSPDPYGASSECRNSSHNECAMFFSETTLSPVHIVLEKMLIWMRKQIDKSTHQ